MNVNLSWQEVDTSCTLLASKLKKFYNTDQCKKTTIIAPTRGGLPLATMLAHRLGIQDIAVVTFVDNAGGNKTITRWPKVDMTGFMNLLIVDDIYDSGHTLTFLKNHYYSLFKKNNIRDYSCNTASLIFRDLETNDAPNFFGNRVYHKDWIVFPWEKK